MHTYLVTDVPEISNVQERSQRTSVLHTTTNHFGHSSVSKSFARRTYHDRRDLGEGPTGTGNANDFYHYVKLDTFNNIRK